MSDVGTEEKQVEVVVPPIPENRPRLDFKLQRSYSFNFLYSLLHDPLLLILPDFGHFLNVFCPSVLLGQAEQNLPILF